MVRNKAFRRDMRNRTIAKRKRFAKQALGLDWYHHDGQYSKGKIHCSCGMCQQKTRGDGWDDGWKHSDQKKLLREDDLA